MNLREIAERRNASRCLMYVEANRSLEYLERLTELSKRFEICDENKSQLEHCPQDGAWICELMKRTELSQLWGDFPRSLMYQLRLRRIGLPYLGPEELFEISLADDLILLADAKWTLDAVFDAVSRKSHRGELRPMSPEDRALQQQLASFAHTDEAARYSEVRRLYFESLFKVSLTCTHALKELGKVQDEMGLVLNRRALLWEDKPEYLRLEMFQRFTKDKIVKMVNLRHQLLPMRRCGDDGYFDRITEIFDRVMAEIRVQMADLGKIESQYFECLTAINNKTELTL